MNLKHLLRDLPVKLYKGGKDVTLTGLCTHSKLVAPGNLFIAKKGSHDDGAKYIDEALAGGAVAILTDFFNPFLKDVAQIVTHDVGAIEAELAARYYGNPSHSLFTIGVTGTNGKTTIAHLVKHLFDTFDMPCGMIGTIEYIIKEHHFAAELTTPEVITNQKLLKEMVKQKCQAAVMEVSSIGLEQGRVANIAFDVAIFSNLSQEHLDYHESMETYAEAKALLFRGLDKKAYALFNADSKWSEKMQSGCMATQLTYGIEEQADLQAHSIELAADQTRFSVSYKGETRSFLCRLIGRFNIYNCLAAMGAALCKGIAFEALPAAIAQFPSVSGRLEKVEAPEGLHIYVDYAHTPDALQKALLALHEVKKGRIITVFGCGGDRDRSKRAVMAQMAEKYSDLVFITSDNPRTEEPLSICKEIATGFTKNVYQIEVDRRAAIEQAIERAGPHDCILIAGKGHETYQIFAHQTFPFDDRQVAGEIANRVIA